MKTKALVVLFFLLFCVSCDVSTPFVVPRINQYGIQGGIYEMVISPTSLYRTQFKSQWWHFLYKIPRRW